MRRHRPGEITGAERLWAAVAHMAILLPVAGILVAVAIRYLNRASWFIRDHARQAIGFQIIVAVVLWGGSLLIQYLGFGGTIPEEPAPEDAQLLMLFFVFLFMRILAAGYGFLAAFRAYMGREFRYALVGSWIEAFYDR